MNQAQIELLQLWLADGAFSQPASVLTASLDQLDGSNAKKVYQANKQADFASFYAQCSIEPPAFPYYAGVAEPTEFVYGETAFRDEAQQLYYYIDADGQPITGKIMRYYDDSALRSVAIAVDGFAEGEIRKYYEGGESPELSLISNMKAGKLADQVSFTHYSELIDKQTATRISGEIIDID
jgi:antitoxin component YwqK of YwqJK toxin-antitoxin module